MRRDDPNIEMLKLAATGLGSMVDDVVFLGGSAAGLLITDPAVPSIRETKDVDVIVEIATLHDYHALSRKLRERGFCEDQREGAPMCRWLFQGVIVDVMPTDSSILGFSNRWYKEAMDFSVIVQLSDSLSIRMVSAPYFLATKLEAFYGRGKGDYVMSHDLEDLIAVLDGRESIVDEVMSCSSALRSYLSKEFTALLKNNEYQEALPGHMPPDKAGQARVGAVLERMGRIAGKE